MNVELVFGCLEECWHATIPRDLLIRFSTLCADMLEDVGSEEQSIVLPIPFVSDLEIARLLVSSFLEEELFLETQPPKVVFELMMAANGMHMSHLLNKIIKEISYQWLFLSTSEIRTQWGFVDNIPESKQEQIALENYILFSVEKEEDDIKNQDDDWGWPIELLTLVLEELSTQTLARVRAVCAECFDIVHTRLRPRGDASVPISSSTCINLKHVSLGLAERHCVFYIENPNDIVSIASLEQSSQGEHGPRHVKILHGAKIGAEWISLLAQLRHLRRVEWEGKNNINKEEMQALCTLSSLEYLEFGERNNLRDTCASLSNLSQLKHLALKCNVGTADMNAVASLEHLEHLEIGRLNHLGGKCMECLKTLSNLTHLEIGDDNNIGEEGAKALSALSALRHFAIGDWNNLGEQGAKALAALSNLTDLEIGRENAIGKEGAKALATLSNLRHLVIGGWNNLGEEGAKALQPLLNLQYLRIGAMNDIGTQATRGLASLPNLKTLSISTFGNKVEHKTQDELWRLYPTKVISFH